MPSYTIRELDECISRSPGGDPAWVQIAPLQQRPVKPPAFLLGDLPAEITYAIFGETATGPVRCYRLRQVRLTVDGIVLAGEDALCTILVNHPDYHVAAIMREMQDVLGSLPIRRVEGRAVMLTGPGSHIYGHWLVDMLPRLFVLAQCGHDLAALTFVVSARLPAFCFQFLHLLGISEDQLIRHDDRGELLEVEELLLPTNLRRGSQIHPLMHQAVQFMCERMQRAPPSAGSAARRRLFISRRGGEPSRTPTNRVAIEAIAAAAGYEIVSPETLAIPEQIALFASATQVIGEYGSGLHSSVFSPPGTVVMALRGTSHHPGFIQSGLGQVFRQPTGFVFSPTPIGAVDQVFTVSEDSFRLGLRCAGLLAQRAAEAA